MPLSRLENFLKNVQGNVIYVNPEELDATDDISNTGNSRTRPFRTIQRALIESARFSYQLGKDNDKFDKTTIMVSPGVHYIDNRPGLQIDTSGSITDVGGSAASISEFAVGSNFDIQDTDNVLYKFNSASGGVIMPRGTSIVGSDLRKTKIRPKYVPDPTASGIEPSAIFRVTGACFFFGFSFFDADPNDRIYKDYTGNVYTPNFSHHKLTCFEYADGQNVITGKGNTDLDMYYHKLTLAYGINSGRALPNYPSNDDFEKVIDETRIVGSISQIGALEIQDIYSGATPSSATATKIVTVVTKTNHNLAVGTPVLIQGVEDVNYDGSFIVNQVINDTNFTYSVPVVPASTATPSLSGLSPTVKIESDSVTSASPYIFNCSIRSVYGLNGLHCDGSKATGFKSIVAAQFTGVSLQKDDNAFVRYNETTGTWQDQATLGTSVSLHTDPNARHKPEYENCHIKASNNAVMQLVSVFAIGYGKHYQVSSGADISITNSNSNFGQRSFVADGYRPKAFTRDDKGYITAIVPPKKNNAKVVNVNWEAIDVDVTAGVTTDSRLYLYGFTGKDTVPSKTANGYNVGNKIDETLSVGIGLTTYSTPVYMPGNNPTIANWSIGKKEYIVGSNSGINSITSNTLTLKTDHDLLAGEKIKIYSKNGSLPDGIEHNKEYFVISSADDKIKLASTFNNAIAGTNLTGINNLGGELRIVSTVEGKKPGEPGHPIQYETNTGWYINVGAGNTLRPELVNNQAELSPKTANTFITRNPDNRLDLDTVYRLRYAVPNNTVAVPPTDGFVIIESGSVVDDNKYQNNNSSLGSVSDLRTDNVIIDATWSSNVGIITAQSPHKLDAGNTIEILRLRSDNNTLGADNSGFNGKFEVLGINDDRTFRIGLNTNPGGITTTTGLSSDVIGYIPYTKHDASIVGSGRTFAPYFTKCDTQKAIQILGTQEIQGYKQDVQDGVYDLTVLGYVAQPNVSPFSTTSNYYPQDINDLRPKTSRDNTVIDPEAAVSYALRSKPGVVKTNDPSKSITKESINSFLDTTNIGIGLSAGSHSGGNLRLDTSHHHGFNGVKATNNLSGGTNLGTGSGNAEFYFNVETEGGGGHGLTVDVTVNAAGSVSAFELNQPGSGYLLGSTVTITGIPFSASGTNATFDITEIDNGVDDIIEVVGMSSESYNGLHKISSVDSNLRVTVPGSATDSATGGYIFRVGKSISITSIQHNHVSGIATVQTAGDIGLRKGDQIVLNSIPNANLNGTYDVTDRVGYGSSVLVNIGKFSTHQASGTITSAYAHGTGLSVRTSNRDIPLYDGVTTKLNSSLGATGSSITLDDVKLLRRGDYLLIEDEIVRVANTTGTSVIRGLLGTNAVQHESNCSVRRIKVLPVENRRYSIIRASGHTFEYVGYGPGNYSTAMPQNQATVLDEDDQLRSQALQTRGGLVAYTGMNDRGDFYIGRKKINAVTGEEIDTIDKFDNTIVGEDSPGGVLTNEFDDLTVNNNLYSNGNTDVVDLKLRGNRSGNLNKSVFVGIQETTPSTTQSQDNILFRVSHTPGGSIGWVKTDGSGSERWQEFGPISYESGSNAYAFDKVAVGQNAVSSGDLFTVAGNAAVGSLKVTDLTSGRVVITGTNGELQDSSSLTFSGAKLTASAIDVTNNLDVDGSIDVDGHTNLDNVSISGVTTTGNLTVSGNQTVTGDVSAVNVTASGTVSAEQLTSTDDATVAGTVTAGDFVGNGVIPIGGIIMWSGTDNNIPSNWVLCDNSAAAQAAGAPNLVDRFVVGRGNLYADDSTGGEATKLLGTANLPSHTHTAGTLAATGGDHAHSYRRLNELIDNEDNGVPVGNTGSAGESHENATTGQSGSLTMSLTGTTGDQGGAMNTAFDILPPYYSIAYIMRVS